MTGRVAQRVFPTLTEPLPTRDELRARVDDEEAWRVLFEEPVGVAVEENFADDLVRGVVLTDALIGTFADAHDPSLRQNRCFLYHVIGGGTGAWDVPVGGMGALTDAMAAAASGAGAVIATGHEAVRIETDGRAAEVTYRTADGEGVVAARHVLVNASPQELAHLTGDEPPTPAEGAQLKVNMLLKRLPGLRDTSVDPREAFSGTFHIAEGYEQLATAHAQAASGELPTAPPSEIYCHSLTDPSILGRDLVEQGYQTLTLFGLHTPARLFERDNDAVREELLKSTLAQLDAHLAEPLADCLATDADGRPCIEAKTPSTWSATCGCPTVTSSTATSPSRTRRRGRAAGASRPGTRTSCCAGRARCAAGSERSARAQRGHGGTGGRGRLAGAATAVLQSVDAGRPTASVRAASAGRASSKGRRPPASTRRPSTYAPRRRGRRRCPRPSVSAGRPGTRREQNGWRRWPGRRPACSAVPCRSVGGGRGCSRPWRDPRGKGAKNLTEHQKKPSLVRRTAAFCGHADGAEQETGSRARHFRLHAVSRRRRGHQPGRRIRCARRGPLHRPRRPQTRPRLDRGERRRQAVRPGRRDARQEGGRGHGGRRRGDDPRGAPPVRQGHPRQVRRARTRRGRGVRVAHHRLDGAGRPHPARRRLRLSDQTARQRPGLTARRCRRARP